MVALTLTLALLVLQAPVTSQDGAAKPMSGVIKGRVLAADTSLPLVRAIVTLRGPAPFPGSPPLSVLVRTDTQGRFELTGLAAGRYTVDARMGAYVPWKFGQRSGPDAGTPIDLKDGEVRTTIDITLPRGGVVTGRVLDEGGEPAAGVTVGVMRVRYVEGRRQMTFAGGSSIASDDRGEYRVYGLPPGKYYISATAKSVEDAKVYYPGTLLDTEAQPITVRAGQERGNTDILLVSAKRIRVSGTAFDLHGRPMTAFIVAATNVATNTAVSQNMTRPDGTFSIDLLPGKHRLTAEQTAAPGAARERAVAIVDVLGADVSGLVLTAAAGYTISGQIRFEGEPPDLAAVPFALRAYRSPASAASLESLGSVPVSAAGTFAIAGVSGGQTIGMEPPVPGGWMLKLVTAGGRDVTDESIDVGSDVTDVVVTLTRRVTGVTGRVTGSDGKSIADYTVIVYADDPARWGYRSRFVSVGRPGGDGGYRVAGLPSDANYLVVAVDYLEQGQEQDPQLLESFRARATKVTLGDGRMATVDLKIVKAGGEPRP